MILLAAAAGWPYSQETEPEKKCYEEGQRDSREKWASDYSAAVSQKALADQSHDR